MSKSSSAGEAIAIASITIREVALLIDSGPVTVHGSTEAFLKQVSQRQWLFVLDLSPEIAALAFQFSPDFPNDPADRIIATARSHGLPLVTKDQPLQDSELLRAIR